MVGRRTIRLPAFKRKPRLSGEVRVTKTRKPRMKSLLPYVGIHGMEKARFFKFLFKQ